MRIKVCTLVYFGEIGGIVDSKGNDHGNELILGDTYAI